MFDNYGHGKIVISKSLYDCPYVYQNYGDYRCGYSDLTRPICSFRENGECRYCISLEDALKNLNK